MSSDGLWSGGGTRRPLAIWQANSTTRGVMIPRLTTTQRDAMVLTSDDEGMTIYNATTDTYNVWSGAAWLALAVTGGTSGSDVTLTPGSATRNLVQPSGDYPGLVLRGNASQSVNLFEGQLSGGSVVASLSAAGVLTVAPSSTDPSTGTTALVVSNTVAQTTASTQALNGMQASAVLNNGTSNNTSGNGVRGNSSSVTVNGTAGTVTNEADYNGSLTVSGGVTLSNARRVRVNAPNVSGGSVITNQSGFNTPSLNQATNNTHVLLGTLTIPSGNWGIYLTDAYDSSLAGKLGLGGNFSPSSVLSASGQAAQTFGMERMTTSNTAGNNLTVQAGGATLLATNKAGGALLLTAGIGTGNAVPGNIRLLADAASPTSGTSDHAQADRLMAGNVKVLTNNSATTILNATLASGSTIGGVIRYTVEVTNGTDYQVETGFAIYSAYNKAGVFGATITEVNSQQNNSTGTLATTWAISSANPAAISINANSSLTPSTGYPRITYTIENFGQQAIAAA